MFRWLGGCSHLLEERIQAWSDGQTVFPSPVMLIELSTIIEIAIGLASEGSAGSSSRRRA